MPGDQDLRHLRSDIHYACNLNKITNIHAHTHTYTHNACENVLHYTHYKQLSYYILYIQTTSGGPE